MKGASIPNIDVKKVGKGGTSDYIVTGFVELPCWTGYFLTEQPNYVQTKTRIEDGRIGLGVDGAITSDGRFQPAQPQVEAYQYLVAHQDGVRSAILEGLRRSLPGLMEDVYSSWDQEEGGFPRLTELTPDFDWKAYIGPSSIDILEDVKDDLAYVLWHFECLWDPEHGFEVVTHKDRVIDIYPEVDMFKVYQDNGTAEQEEERLKNMTWNLPQKKPWWKFW